MAGRHLPSGFRSGLRPVRRARRRRCDQAVREAVPPEGTQAPDPTQLLAANGRSVVVRQFPQRPAPSTPAVSSRARLLGTAADLTVAVVVAFASAAAGSRLLWPVLLIACYYAVGVLITGTSPMVALLSDGLPASPKPKGPPAPAPVPVAATEPAPARQPGRHAARLAGERPVRQRRGMQAPV